MWDKSKSHDLLPLKCEKCEKTFFIKKFHILSSQRGQMRNKFIFCSNNCFNPQRKKKTNCSQCGNYIERNNFEFKKSKNHFCSRSCAASYNNTHKIYGTRRSKLEIYIEEQLMILYPNLHIDYNKKEAINSELDIYIPSLKLAFELNGIFHYEPIFGEKKLSFIKNNDERKFQACIENKISLCIIDVSSFKKFKEDKAKKFLNIILEVLEKKKATFL